MSNKTQHIPADVRERVLKVLTAIEWAAQVDHPDGGWYACCPWCEGGDPDDEETPPGRAGHAELCELAAVLALLRTPRGDGEAKFDVGDPAALRLAASKLEASGYDVLALRLRMIADQIKCVIAARRPKAQGDAEALAAADMERVPTPQEER